MSMLQACQQPAASHALPLASRMDVSKAQLTTLPLDIIVQGSPLHINCSPSNESIKSEVSSPVTPKLGVYARNKTCRYLRLMVTFQ